MVPPCSSRGFCVRSTMSASQRRPCCQSSPLIPDLFVPSFLGLSSVQHGIRDGCHLEYSRCQTRRHLTLFLAQGPVTPIRRV